MISLIVKHEHTYHDFDFDSKEALENEIKEFKPSEKRELFEFVLDYGIPVQQDGKSNWGEIREKFFAYNTKYEAKNIAAIEKLVQYMRDICLSVIQKKKLKEQNIDFMTQFADFKLAQDFNISFEEAKTFFVNQSKLKFVRKKILSNNSSIFRSSLEALKKASAKLKPEEDGYIGSEKYNCKADDL